VGETPHLFPVIRGLVVFHAARAELATALDLSTRLLRVAERTGQSSQLLVAHFQIANVYFYLGQPSVALEHFERALAQYDPSQHQSLSALYQTVPGVNVRIWMAWTLWILGFPDRALTMSREGVAIAREVVHPFSLGYALLWTAILYQWRGERALARKLSAEAVEVADEHDIALVRAGGRMVHSVSRLDPDAEASQIAAAIADFQHALTDLEAAGTGSTGAGRTHALGVLADALVGVGEYEFAGIAVDAALSCSKETSQAYWDAELYRVKAELLARGGAMGDEVEGHLRLALEIARQQEARMLELRAAISLGLLKEGREDRGEVRALLAGIYGAFTEGFETADLVAARALIDRLA